MSGILIATRWKPYAQALPRVGANAWRTNDVRAAAGWIVGSRLVIASACVAGLIVAGWANALLMDIVAVADPDLTGPMLTRPERWAFFQRAWVSEALLTLVLGAAVLRHTFRADPLESGLRRAFLGSVAAGALHVPLFPLAQYVVSLGFDVVHLQTGLGGPTPAVHPLAFTAATIVACVPLGAAFGAVYAIATLLVHVALDPATGRSLWAARSQGVGFVALALFGVLALGNSNHLDGYWIAPPALVLAVILTVDLTTMSWLFTRNERWLAAIRAGRVPGYRLVLAAAAHVNDDLPPFTGEPGPLFAVVCDRAPTYRHRPQAVALVPMPALALSRTSDAG